MNFVPQPSEKYSTVWCAPYVIATVTEKSYDETYEEICQFYKKPVEGMYDNQIIKFLKRKGVAKKNSIGFGKQLLGFVKAFGLATLISVCAVFSIFLIGSGLVNMSGLYFIPGVLMFAVAILGFVYFTTVDLRPSMCNLSAWLKSDKKEKDCFYLVYTPGHIMLSYNNYVIDNQLKQWMRPNQLDYEFNVREVLYTQKVEKIG